MRERKRGWNAAETAADRLHRNVEELYRSSGHDHRHKRRRNPMSHMGPEDQNRERPKGHAGRRGIE